MYGSNENKVRRNVTVHVSSDRSKNMKSHEMQNLHTFDEEKPQEVPHIDPVIPVSVSYLFCLTITASYWRIYAAICGDTNLP